MSRGHKGANRNHSRKRWTDGTRIGVGKTKIDGTIKGREGIYININI